MEKTRFEQQLEFLIEIDKMKNIIRRTLLTDKSRRENDAEHSWHIGVMAMLLKEYAEPEVNIERAVKMCLVHDLIEIYAGDTPAFDTTANVDKAAREKASADKLYALLPEDLAAEFRSLWEEFDAEQTKDAQYAASLDRLQPFIHNVVTDGGTWLEFSASKAQVYKRMDPVRIGTPALWPWVEQEIAKGIAQGLITEE